MGKAKSKTFSPILGKMTNYSRPGESIKMLSNSEIEGKKKRPDKKLGNFL